MDRTFEDEAAEIGKNAARAAATWIVDGNTPIETARKMLQQLRDGDPAAEEWMPQINLSGEFAEDWTPRSLLNRIAGDLEIDELGDGRDEEGNRIPAEELEGIFSAFEDAAAEKIEEACESELLIFLGEYGIAGEPA